MIDRPCEIAPHQPPGGAVHIWQACFADWEPQAARLAAWLSADERARMRRFREPALAARYAIGRGLLRQLLAGCLGDDPAALAFRVNGWGKPSLRDTSAVHFNVTHTQERLMIALCAGRPVGIDAERIDEGPISDAEVERVLAPDERAYWHGLTAEAQTAFFFQTWVRKEAVLKALGVGLQIEPSTFSSGTEAIRDELRLADTPLRLFDLEMTGPIMAALAVIGPEIPGKICLYELPASGLAASAPPR